MNKQELLENYTMEQLADMVVKLQGETRECKENQIDEVFFMSDIRPYASETAIMRINETGSFSRTHIITDEAYNGLWDDKNKYEKLSDERKTEINCLKEKLHCEETTISQIDDILNELFGVTHDVAKPDEFKKILKEKIENCKTIADFLPTEPIKVADMLINTMCEPCANVFSFGKPYSMYDMSELRQIAEHLLIYCNANGGEE